MADSAVSTETIPKRAEMAPINVEKNSGDTPSDDNVILRKRILPGPDEDLSTYVTLPPCSHLEKVLASPASEVVLRTYSTAIKICIMEPPEPPARKKHRMNYNCLLYTSPSPRD